MSGFVLEYRVHAKASVDLSADDVGPADDDAAMVAFAETTALNHMIDEREALVTVTNLPEFLAWCRALPKEEP